MYKKLFYKLLGNSWFLNYINSDKITILTYHRVLEEGKGSLIILKKNFERQMKYISENYNVISFKDLLEKRVKKNSIIITFDDGYKDILENAYPILKKYNIKATLFITTNFINGKKPKWEKEENLFMKWSDIKKLNFEIGAHSISHPILSQCSLEEMKKETSKEEIEKRLGMEVYVFSYPYGNEGDINEVVKEVVKKNYKLAVSNIFGLNSKKLDKYCLKRINIFYNDLDIFKVKIKGIGRWKFL